jgi:anti-sigma regulatory factor (Ser/Thr protein kinase)
VSRHTSEHYRAILGSDPAEIGDVRAAIMGLAIRYGFGDRAADLVLALDEIIANAQEHGRAPVMVDAWNDGRLIVEVSDAGTGFDRTSVWQTHPPEPLGARGRGLWIARQLADHLEITIDAEGTTVRLEIFHDPQIGA